MKFTLPLPLVAFATSAIVVTGIFFTIYATVHQTYRQSANDPQIQMAEEGASAINAGSDVSAAVAALPVVDIGMSLVPFIAVYTTSGIPIASNGRLNGEMITPPLGVFEHAKADGENIVTLQPTAGVRIAAVVKPVNGKDIQFLLIGRSLRVVEQRVDRLNSTILMGWGASLLVLALGCALATRRFSSHV